jgi:hypothetical protein
MALITTELASLLSTVRQPGDFFTAGTTELLAPLVAVDGVGPLALPLLPMQAQQLVATADPAPYGRGEETVIDTTVRRCWQIGPDRVHISGRHWAETLRTIVARVSEGLGVSEPITAEFYKLLVYDQGSFFVSHRDTEKMPGMFATLLVVLPSQFAGGELAVRHNGREVRLDLRGRSRGGRERGLLCGLRARGPARHGRLPPDYAREQAGAAALLQAWRAATSISDEDRPEKLVYLLEHAYTPAELGFAALKGVDRAVAGVLAAAAPQAQCELHLALLTIEENGAAEYPEHYGSRRGRWEEEDDFEAGEVFDRSVILSEWRRPDGNIGVFGEIPVEDQELSPPDACDELAPDEEHFHEATGNEGASFERIYRRAALVLWPSDRIVRGVEPGRLGGNAAISRRSDPTLGRERGGIAGTAVARRA